MTFEIALICLTVFLCYREWFHSVEREKVEDRYFKERQILLDRIMAMDFSKYKQAEMMINESKKPRVEPETQGYYDYSDVGN